MIPAYLQEYLKDEIDKLFNEELGYTLTNANGDQSPINVYEQYLPIRKLPKDPDLFPHIRVIMAETGRQAQADDSPQTAKFFIAAGVWNEDTERGGYKDVRSLLTKIDQWLQRTIILDNKYEVLFPVNWQFDTEDSYPTYFGMLEVEITVGTVTLDSNII